MNFKALAIDGRDANGNITTVEATLDKLADKVSTCQDQVTAGRALSVRGGDKDLLPLLQKGQAGLHAFVRRAQETGGVMIADMAAAKPLKCRRGSHIADRGRSEAVDGRDT